MAMLLPEAPWLSPGQVYDALLSNVPGRRMSELRAQLLLNRKGTQTRAEIAQSLSLSRPALLDLARLFNQRGIAVDGQPPACVVDRAAGRPSIPLVARADYLTTAGVYENAGKLSITVRAFGGKRIAEMSTDLGADDRPGSARRSHNDISAQAVRQILTEVPDCNLNSLAICSAQDSTVPPSESKPNYGGDDHVADCVTTEIPLAALVARCDPPVPGRRTLLLTNSGSTYRGTLLVQDANGGGAIPSLGHLIGNMLIPIVDESSGSETLQRWGAATSPAAWRGSTGSAKSLMSNGGFVGLPGDIVITDNRLASFVAGLRAAADIYEANEVLLAASPWVEVWARVRARTGALLSASNARQVDVRICDMRDSDHTYSSLLAEAAAEMSIVRRWREF